ncbi:hypothetical protein V5O48_002144 [Marasmius crinis-equi]|uniref:Extracellular membrane protein CFEM domain-containing protein n=1 Tax=Marasmius crinis-equi TaxID=585013 RepID=A0ABR3FWD0_9AGAR
MRAFFVLSALAIASVAAVADKRQEEPSTTAAAGTETSTTIIDSSAGGSSTTTANSSGGTGSAGTCDSVCDAASVVYSGCHNESNSLACFCQSRSINTLAACASCKRSSGAVSEAEPLEEQIGGIIQACNSQSSTVAPPTGITITKTASIGNPSSISAPAGAKITSASGSKSSSVSKTGTATGPSGSASSNSNGASSAFGVAGSLAGIVGAGAIALFI